MPVNAFTITSNNYLGMARVFADSYLAHHPGATVYACLVDRPCDAVRYDDLPFEVIFVEDLDIPRFPAFSFKYDILELNTAVKPFVFKYLRDVVGVDRAFYFDPDIWVHDRLIRLEDALDRNQAVLTPHLTEPIDNRCRPPERVIGMCGVYNLGFLGLRFDEGTRRFIDWWCDRLDRYCFVDLANGMFVDQSWMDFAPAYLDSVAIVRDQIFNIAYWNLPHRYPEQENGVWKVGGQRMGFFHFSGVDFRDASLVSRHQDRVDLGMRPELRPLFDHYAGLVERSGQNSYKKIGYSYGSFSGTDIRVPAVARRALHEVDPNGLRWPDPFDVEGEDSFLAWLVAPVVFEGGLVNRAALYLWQHDENLQREFPRIDGDDLPRFVQWFVTDGGIQYALDEVFVDCLSAALDRQGVFNWKRFREIRLPEPGAAVHWLNEPVDHEPHRVLTRLAMAIYSSRPDLQARFPEPLLEDRLEFSYWMVRFGAAEYGLHSSLTAPMARSLPFRSRVSLGFRTIFGVGRTEKDGVRSLLPPNRRASAGGRIRLRADRTLQFAEPPGVNVVGCYSGPAGIGGFAPAICDALTEAGIPNVAVEMDHDLPDIMTTSRIRFESGAPFPVTVLALPPTMWDSTIRKLPVACRAGGQIIGYCCDPVEAIRATDMTGVDEVWVPTHEEAHRIVDISPVPVRPVMAPLPGWCAGGWEPRFKLEEERRWFLGVDYGRGEEDDLAISRAVECLRRINRDGSVPAGLLLLVGAARSALASEIPHLPVRVHDGPITADVVCDALDACDVVLDLSRNPRLGPIGVEAALSGKVVMAGRWKGLLGASPGGAAQEFVLIETGDASSEVIENTARMMREIVNRPGPASARSTQARDEALRDEWKKEAGDQWRREVLRVFKGEL